MKLLLSLLTAPITAPIRGTVWIANQVLDTARRQYFDLEAIHAELVALNRSFDAGEMDEEEFGEREAMLLDRLEEAEAWHAGLAIEEGEQ